MAAPTAQRSLQTTSWAASVSCYNNREAPLAAGHERPPEDRCSCVYLALVLAGVGFLLPYNSFITAVDYFQDKYPRTTIVFDMNLVYILTAFLAVVVNNLLVETLPLQVRITFGYLLSFATLLFVALVEVHWESFDHDVGYTVNLVAIAIVALGCTVQQSSFYGYTSMLPSRYTQAVMTGESAAGVLVSANRILTKALLRETRGSIRYSSSSSRSPWSCSASSSTSCCIEPGKNNLNSLLNGNTANSIRFVRFYLDLCAAAAEEGKSDGDDALHSRILLEPTEDVGLLGWFSEDRGCFCASKATREGTRDSLRPCAVSGSSRLGSDSFHCPILSFTLSRKRRVRTHLTLTKRKIRERNVREGDNEAV
ncbi:hypothetical protein MTO96_003253 [Rhipicephalus appendiculatus]